MNFGCRQGYKWQATSNSLLVVLAEKQLHVIRDDVCCDVLGTIGITLHSKSESMGSFTAGQKSKIKT